MLRPRTLKILTVMLGGYGLATVPAYWGPSWLESISAYFVMAPLLSIYIFHAVGVPGLLEHNGACGWAWCSPTVFGWLFLGLVWLAIAWLIAWGAARLIGRRRDDAA